MVDTSKVIAPLNAARRILAAGLPRRYAERLLGDGA